MQSITASSTKQYCLICVKCILVMSTTKFSFYKYQILPVMTNSKDVAINLNQTISSDFKENCQKRLYGADHKGQTVSPAIKRAAADQRGPVWSLGRRDLPQTGLRFRLKVKQQCNLINKHYRYASYFPLRSLNVQVWFAVKKSNVI